MCAPLERPDRRPEQGPGIAARQHGQRIEQRVGLDQSAVQIDAERSLGFYRASAFGGCCFRHPAALSLAGLARGARNALANNGPGEEDWRRRPAFGLRVRRAFNVRIAAGGGAAAGYRLPIRYSFDSFRPFPGFPRPSSRGLRGTCGPGCGRGLDLVSSGFPDADFLDGRQPTIAPVCLESTISRIRAAEWSHHILWACMVGRRAEMSWPLRAHTPAQGRELRILRSMEGSG